MTERIPPFPLWTAHTFEDWAQIDGKWHHIAVVFPESTGAYAAMPQMFIDGSEEHPMAEMALFDRALTGEEMEAHVRVGMEPVVGDPPPSVDNPPVAYWRLGEAAQAALNEPAPALDVEALARIKRQASLAYLYMNLNDCPKCHLPKVDGLVCPCGWDGSEDAEEVK